MPRQVHGNQLETKVLSSFEKVGRTIGASFIDECHRLGKNNEKVTIKFSCRKKNLNDLNTDDLDLPSGTTIFVNQS